MAARHARHTVAQIRYNGRHLLLAQPVAALKRYSANGRIEIEKSAGERALPGVHQHT